MDSARLQGMGGCTGLCYTGLALQSDQHEVRTVVWLVLDVVLFVLACIGAVLSSIRHPATRRGSRLGDVRYLYYAVMMLTAAVIFPQLDHMLPPAWQFAVQEGLVMLAFLILFLLATTVRRRQVQ